MAVGDVGHDVGLKIEEAREALASVITRSPELGIVLGSGLGYLADGLDGAVAVPFERVPNFSLPTVEGHGGLLVVGEMAGKTVIMMRGRPHFYEGYSQEEVTFPIRVLAALGVNLLLITNASGGIDDEFRAGDIMLINDHINLPALSGWNPLRGCPDEPGRSRFVSMNNAYDPQLRGLALEVAGELGLSLRQGVYAMVAGPSYETPAEVRFLKAIGANAVGMSTAGETIVARHCGMRVLGLSCITNVVTAESTQVSHEEVLSVAGIGGPKLASLITGIVSRL